MKTIITPIHSYTVTSKVELNRIVRHANDATDDRLAWCALEYSQGYRVGLFKDRTEMLAACAQTSDDKTGWHPVIEG